MKKVLLDTSFIITCVRNKIDFFEELYLKGFNIIIPKQVISELKGLNSPNQKLKLREEVRLSLRLIEANKNMYDELELPGKAIVDKKIINYAKANPEIVVATLDKEIKKAIKNPKLAIRVKKKLEII